MTKKKNPSAKHVEMKRRNFRGFLTPEYLIACQDAIIAQDQTVSIMRIVDIFLPYAIPLTPPRLMVVVQFDRNTDISVNELISAGLTHKLVLESPSGELTELGQFGLGEISKEQPWTTTRSIFDLSGRIVMKEIGAYTLKVLGKTGHSDYEILIERKLPLKLAKGLAGLYDVIFSALPIKNAGIGVAALLPDGSIQGGDDGYVYTGKYVASGDEIQAKLQIRRMDPKKESVFGDIEHFELILEGTKKGDDVLLKGAISGKPKKKIFIQLNRRTQSVPLNSKKG